jgi:hypothetical protein
MSRPRWRKDKWLYFVRNAGRLNAVPRVLDEAPIRDAFAIANTAGLTPEELEAQERRHDFIRLQRGAQAKAFEDGQAEGRLAVARNLPTMLDDDAITAATGLSREAVARLRAERASRKAVRRNRLHRASPSMRFPLVYRFQKFRMSKR